MERLGLVVLGVCLVGCAGTTGDSAASRSSANSSDEQLEQVVAEYNESVSDEKDKVICTRESQVGTHFSRRVCRTVRQIELEREETRRALDDLGGAPVGGK